MASVFVYGMTWVLLTTSTGTITTAAPPQLLGSSDSEQLLGNSDSDSDADNAGVSTSLTNNVPEFRVSLNLC